jgi:hypothetical protein
MESADHQQEEPVPSSQAWAALGSEGDLELLTQEQSLEKELVMAAEGAGRELEESEHHIRIARLALACAGLEPPPLIFGVVSVVPK